MIGTIYLIVYVLAAIVITFYLWLDAENLYDYCMGCLCGVLFAVIWPLGIAMIPGVIAWAIMKPKKA
jgi:hypothetical protein